MVRIYVCFHFLYYSEWDKSLLSIKGRVLSPLNAKQVDDRGGAGDAPVHGGEGEREESQLDGAFEAT